MGHNPVKGNFPLLFILFFGLTTLLAGLTYKGYQAYASSGSLGPGVGALSTGIGFVFALAMVARILYKAAGVSGPPPVSLRRT